MGDGDFAAITIQKDAEPEEQRIEFGLGHRLPAGRAKTNLPILEEEDAVARGHADAHPEWGDVHGGSAVVAFAVEPGNHQNRDKRQADPQGGSSHTTFPSR